MSEKLNVKIILQIEQYMIHVRKHLLEGEGETIIEVNIYAIHSTVSLLVRLSAIDTNH